MKCLLLAFLFAAGFLAAHLSGGTAAADPQPSAPPKADPPGTAGRTEVPPPNPNIDMTAFLTGAQAAAKHRESRRLSEDDFLMSSQEEGVIVLDARSQGMYDLLHVKGAIHLSFPDINIESLKKTLPDKKAKILIYCNNNFTPAPGQNAARVGPPATPMAVKAAAAFSPKSAGASLNLSTYVALHSYGYTNVYELAPLLDPTKTKLTLVSTAK